MSIETQPRPRPTPIHPESLKAPYKVTDLPALKTLALEQSGRLSGAQKWIDDHPNMRQYTRKEAEKRIEQLLTGYSVTCSIIRRLERLQEKGAVNE